MPKRLYCPGQNVQIKKEDKSITMTICLERNCRNNMMTYSAKSGRSRK